MDFPAAVAGAAPRAFPAAPSAAAAGSVATAMNAATAAGGPAAQIAWHSLFDGKSLGKWTPTQFGTQGKVEVKDGKIVIGSGDGCSGITWTGDVPKGDYELRLQAMRVEGGDFFCGVTFPVADSFCSFICGGWGGGLVGISSIDGEDASSNDTTKFMKFDEKRWYAIRVQVRKDHLSAWIDDDSMVDEPLTDRKLTTRSEVDLSKPLGIATWRTTGAVRDIKWRALTDADTPH